MHHNHRRNYVAPNEHHTSVYKRFLQRKSAKDRRKWVRRMIIGWRFRHIPTKYKNNVWWLMF